MKKLLTIWLVFLSIGVIFPNLYGDVLNRVLHGLKFGAITYPTSLDVFENPSATQSVATVVTHSTHHANANDALEAIEAKVGTGASTPIANSLFAGNGAGTSIWTTFATGTQAYFTNFFATGSSTLSNFTFLRATGTAATTTDFFSTSASSTNLFSTAFYGGGLGTCSGSSFLQWTSGSFGCATPSGVSSFSTTTAVNLATTTLRVSDGSLPDKSNWIISFIAPNYVGAGTTTNEIIMIFNNDFTANYAYNIINNGVQANNNARQGVELIGNADNLHQKYLHIEISNITGAPKFGSFDGWTVSTSTSPSVNVGSFRSGEFVWPNTNAITQIDIGSENLNAFFGTSTRIEVIGY